MAHVIVLANRAPFSCQVGGDGGLTITRASGGLVTALEPLVESWAGTWIAQSTGSGDATIADYRGGVSMPPRHPRYRLRYVWLSEAEQQGYYRGFANEGLWPLCHEVHVEPVFRRTDFDMYRRANLRFADAVVDEARDHDPVVLVQDYHFALAPRMLRRRLPFGTIATFWHIPWPSAETMVKCSWSRELIEGLLGSHVIGFQTPQDCENFVATAALILGAHVNRHRDRVHYRDDATIVRPYPVGVDWTSSAIRDVPSADVCRQHWLGRLGLPHDAKLIVGVDRLDYTKGIPHKLAAIERVLEASPEISRRCAFIQVAEPSRGSVPAYQAERAEVLKAVARVNGRFARGHGPVHLIESHCDMVDVYRLYRAADVCYVGSLRDGMNLVAKEFVSARNDERGVLVLSRYAGAAQQLGQALMIDPYAVEQSADVLTRAIAMSASEQAYRMRALRSDVAAFDARWWMRQLVGDVLTVHRRARTEDAAETKTIGRSMSA